MDLNGEINADDGLAILKHFVKLQMFDPTDTLRLALADVNHDNEIGSDDALDVLKIIVRLKEKEPYLFPRKIQMPGMENENRLF